MKAHEILQKEKADIYLGNGEERLMLYTETGTALPPDHPAVIGMKGTVLPKERT